MFFENFHKDFVDADILAKVSLVLFYILSKSYLWQIYDECYINPI